MDIPSSFSRIAFIGNYTPRKCGIATFTADVCESIATLYPETSCIAVPVNDRPEGYDYPPRVRFELQEQDIQSYRQAADFLNINNVELVSVQHEYGIFGGPSGSHLLALLEELQMPIVTTLHTVLKDPTREQRRVLQAVAARSDRLVVMAEKGIELLETSFGIGRQKVDLIPHGIPDVAFVDPNFYKDQFGVEGKTVLLTFGLLSPNKGIENVIRALPSILEHDPEVVYLVLGATHPHLVAREGENYRLSLQRMAEACGVQKNVIFYNRFVSFTELTEFIGAADIYITPYLNEAQITSGTLVRAFGAGKAVVSTPYWHAAELLANDQGILVPFADSEAIAREVVALLDDEPRRHSMRKTAYLKGRDFIWPEIARRYMETFEKARKTRETKPRKSFAGRTLSNQPYQLPPLKLDHLRRITDSTGILQHSIFNVPDYKHGYCTDDNARAFILTTLLEEAGYLRGEALLDMANTYLAFLWHAFDPDSKRFRNFMSYDRRWLEDVGSEDSHGRALWAVGTAIGRSSNEGYRQLAGKLFGAALEPVSSFTSPRAWAFAIMALQEYMRRFPGDRVANRIRHDLAQRLLGLFDNVASNDWPWFENVVTYDNAKLSHALILSGYWMPDKQALEVGLKSLKWLTKIQTGPSGCFSPVGCNGFYHRGGIKPRFDQQALEAHAMTSACLDAYQLTRDTYWHQEAARAFEWFLGRNDLGLPLYDAGSGGCRDGLHPDGINQNQGAESSLCFYLSQVEMELAQNIHALNWDDALDTAHPPTEPNQVATPAVTL